MGADQPAISAAGLEEPATGVGLGPALISNDCDDAAKDQAADANLPVQTLAAVPA